MHLRFLVRPNDGELGPDDHQGKKVDYELTVPGHPPRVETTSYGQPLDTDVDLDGGDHVEIRVRFPWARAERLREFRDAYLQYG